MPYTLYIVFPFAFVFPPFQISGSLTTYSWFSSTTFRELAPHTPPISHFPSPFFALALQDYTKVQIILAATLVPRIPPALLLPLSGIDYSDPPPVSLSLPPVRCSTIITSAAH